MKSVAGLNETSKAICGQKFPSVNIHEYFIATIFEEFSINKLLHVNAIVNAEVNITMDLV